MLKAIREWLKRAAERRERQAFETGYVWAGTMLATGEKTVEDLEALSLGSFNTRATHYAFDRGVQRAIAEATTPTARG